MYMQINFNKINLQEKYDIFTNILVSEEFYKKNGEKTKTNLMGVLQTYTSSICLVFFKPLYNQTEINIIVGCNMHKLSEPSYYEAEQLIKDYKIHYENFKKSMQ